MHRDIVVVGASAGGVEALSLAVSGLPADLPAAVFVVLHLPAHAPSHLATVLQRHTSLPTTSPFDGEHIRSGHVYVAPPDHHLLLRSGMIHLSRGAQENGHRPSVDTLFRSAAHTYGARVIGAVLSGALDDGAAGLSMIASHGGMPIVQDPEDAAFSGMPLSALAAVRGAMVVPAHQLGRVIGELSGATVQVEGMAGMADATQPRAQDENPDGWSDGRYGQPSVFTCPECHGTLFLAEEGDISQFRCRVGHRFSADSLLAAESEALEAALWTALRSLEERNDLHRRMAERARRQGQVHVADRFQERVREGDRNAGLLRQVLLSGETARDEPAS